MTVTQAQVPIFASADLDLLAQLVENEKCALILGPFASDAPLPDGSRLSTRKLLARELAEAYFEKNKNRLPEPENLGLVCTAWMAQPDVSRTNLEIKVRDFYKRHTDPSPLLLEAARLPFRILFTTSPDELLQKAFSMEKKRSFRDGYYRFSKTQKDDYDDTPEDWAYLYQLLGRVLDKPDGSLPLTVADQLEYIDSVQGVGKETRLPAGLRNAMQDCEAFLFLGFDYDNWYLRVLFHILKFSEKAKLVFGLPEGASVQMPPGTEAFFREQFKFSFLENKPVELLRGIRQRIESGASGQPAGQKATQKLLYLYAPADEDFKDKLDRQLSMLKKAHGLESASVHDFAIGEIQRAENQAIESASVIIPILSSDFFADDHLVNNLLSKALARQSASVAVAAVYAREVHGAADLFRGKAPIFPAESLSVGFVGEETGLPMVAKLLEPLISALK